MNSQISAAQAKKMINDKLSHFFGVTPQLLRLNSFIKQ